MEYDNSNRGKISKNEKKTKDSHPDYKGILNVNGVAFWVSGWIKTNQEDGKKFLSLSVNPKEDMLPKPTSKQNDFSGDDSDLPF